MPRIRTLKPEALQHRKVGKLSDRAFRLWVALITQADDHGRFLVDWDYLKVVIWGYHRKVTTRDVQQAMTEITQTGMVRIWDTGGQRYGYFPSWADHQRVQHPSPSLLPAPPELELPKGHNPDPPPEPVMTGSGTFMSAHEASRTFMNVPDPPRARAQIGSDRILSDRIVSEGIKRGGSNILPAEAPPAEGAPSGQPKKSVQFKIPPDVEEALTKCPAFRSVTRLADPAWWQGELRANNEKGVRYASEVLRAQAWLNTNSRRAPRRDMARFLHNWFDRANGGPE
jgi:hypothetical protein